VEYFAVKDSMMKPVRPATTSIVRAHQLRTRRWRVTDAPDIAESLADRSIEIRCEAAEALGRLLRKKQRAPSALRQAAADRNSLVRTCVAEALGDIGDKSAAAVLRRLLRGRDAIVRSYAATALAAAGGQSARRHLRLALARERSPTARVGLNGALISLGDHAQIDPLLALLSSRRYRVRCAVANTLVSWVTVPAEARPRVVDALRAAIAVEDTRAARSSLVEALRHVRERQRSHRRR
jgi:hypothetical protein